MNKPNNARRKESQNKIENAFIALLQTNEINQIAVSAICKAAKVNRSTFYANYLDIYDLVDKIQIKLESLVLELYEDEREKSYNTNDFLKLFKHIKENQLFYKTYFKLGLDSNSRITDFDTDQAEKYYNNEYIDYHMAFFKAGLNAILKKWLDNDCKETPEEIKYIIDSEYGPK